ncbi:MAG: biliverdin-producing heme oxygenase [Kofleriaceae bacterium]|nr:biliverdin-producing heme oxygenase [Kofleriaceae bacterium]
MEEVSSLLVRLNLATRQYHADVDEPWLALLRPSVGIADYVATLIRTYGLVAPFESACKYTPGLLELLDFRQHMRAGLIAQDLLALGVTPLQVATIETCPTISIFPTVANALGWLYVMERSTLLHDGIRRHLQRDLWQLDRACAYLRACGAHVGDRWAAFGRLLDRVGRDPTTANEIVHASRDAFGICGRWSRLQAKQARSTG